MDDQFTIRYPNGQITLNRAFFPASKHRISRIMRIINITDDPEIVRAALIKHLVRLMEITKDTLQIDYNAYQVNIDKARGYEPKIFEKEQTLFRAKCRYKEMPRGSECKKLFKKMGDELREELKDLKEKYNHHKRSAAAYNGRVKKADRDYTGLKMNVEVLKSYE